ncbi:MAG: type II toxin-antitoxin system VapC family toxin [Candidatus Methanomethyliaceae archaeon]|nr:type II toxin-antitoxin system VapC family toxin [Candidatus Methanomethyliaceae archaeon]
MIYIDSNIFIYAALNLEDLGDRARALLRDVQEGKQRAASSALTFDEIVWAVRKYRSFEDSVAAGEVFLNMPNLKIVEVSGDILAMALELMRRYRLDPRDSIHAASAISKKTKVILSSDEHFDRVKEIRRKGL